MPVMNVRKMRILMLSFAVPMPVFIWVITVPLEPVRLCMMFIMRVAMRRLPFIR